MPAAKNLLLVDVLLGSMKAKPTLRLDVIPCEIGSPPRS